MSQQVQVHRISSCNICPGKFTPESEETTCLTPWDVAMVSVNYIQKGLLFKKPPHQSTQTILEQLRDSLSQTLNHFPLLAGRLVTKKGTDPPSYGVFISCTDSPGAEFIYATAETTIAEVISTEKDLHQEFLKSLFAFDEIINHDGHVKPLVAVQVTELLDGIFIGVSLNHTAGDGSSFWHFFNTWSEISAKGDAEGISRPPITKRWFPDNHDHIINLPFTHHDQFLDRYLPPPLRERMLHFSAESIRRLKAKANAEQNTTKISSFQALSAFIWRAITRARQMPVNQETSCRLAIDNRSRLDPPLSNNYFGNCIQTVKGTTTAGELLANNLGWSAWLLHQAVSGHTDREVRKFLEEWVRAPFIYQYGRFFDPNSVMVGSSPRFSMYENDFGWGRPLAIRSGFGSKFDGKVSSYQGLETGSVDVEVCLPPDSMRAFLSDEEFMDAVTYTR